MDQINTEYILDTVYYELYSYNLEDQVRLYELRYSMFSDIKTFIDNTKTQ